MAITEKKLPIRLASGHVPELDGVRGIAILLVLIYHYEASLIAPGTGFLALLNSGLFSLTWSGVDLFFVLSGFLIGGILLDQRDTHHYFKAFYARRVTRILPLYFAWLFLSIVISTWSSGITPSVPSGNLLQNPLTFLAYLTLTQNFTMAFGVSDGPPWLGVTWSLGVEEQFYLALPILIRFVSPRKLPYLLVTLIAAAPILRIAVLYLPPHSTFAAYALMPCRADALLLGVLCAYLIRQDKFLQKLTKHVGSLYIFMLVSLIGLEILIQSAITPTASVFLIAIGYSLIALGYSAFLLIAVIERRGFVSGLARTRLLRKLGVIAYGIYLFHEAPLVLSHGLFLHQAPALDTFGDVAVTFGALCLTVLVAQGSWNYFEKPIVAFGRSVEYSDPIEKETSNIPKDTAQKRRWEHVTETAPGSVNRDTLPTRTDTIENTRQTMESKT